jgi:probable FeS assembly SUF system protein SufT
MPPLGTVQTRRSCKATLMPDDFQVLFPEGTRLIVQQVLEDSFVVKTYWGDVARIAAKDGDALGDEYAAARTAAEAKEPFREEAVWDALRTVYDPEIPVNIVDLGLIYDIRCTELPGGGHSVVVVMTLTAPGCGMSELIKADVEQEAYCVPGVRDVAVNIVFDPPWSMDRMTEAAKLELGFM